MPKTKYYSSSRRKRKRFLPRKQVCQVVEPHGPSSGSAHDMGSPSSFTKVLTSKYQIHTSVHHCVLVLPRPFCDEHNVANNLTMTDSIGHTLWHMRCQNRRATRGHFIISKGWREFSYEHGLKQNDKLVFTLVSPSHFVVEFATSMGLIRVMRPTRDEKEYRAGASSGSAPEVSTPPSFTKLLTSKYQIHSSVHQCALNLPKLFCAEHNVANHVTMTDSTGHTLWHMRCQIQFRATTGGYLISNGWREFAHDHSLQVNDKLVFTLVSPSHFVVEFANRVMRQTRDGKEYPWLRHNISWRNYSENVQGVAMATTISVMASKQRSIGEMQLCQSNSVKVKNRNSNSKDSTKMHCLPEFTHLECKNPDGTSYLQIFDSDSEVTDGDEENAPESILR